MVSRKTLNFVSIESQCFSMFPSAPPPYVLSGDNQIQNGLGNQIFLPTGLRYKYICLPFLAFTPYEGGEKTIHLYGAGVSITF